MNNNPTHTPAERIAFEKSRLEYCLDIFNREEERREQLEKKSQFYLSFITLFLGAIFLKTDSLAFINELTANQTIPVPVMTVFYLAILLLGFFILFSVIAILQVTRLWSYRGPFPKEIVEILFSPDSDFLEEQTQACLMRTTALNYAIALESNTSINDRKSKWIMVSSFGIFSSVVAFAILIGVIIYLAVNF
jgi:hypothetical protein